MMKLTNIYAFAILVGVVLSGCTMTTGPLTDTFGVSHELISTNQTLNPEASANLAPVESMDGEAAKLSIDRYRNSFETAPTQPTFVLPVGDIR